MTRGSLIPTSLHEARTLADLSDFISFHSYNAGNIDWQISYIEMHSKKPIVLEETGWPTGPPAPTRCMSQSQQNLLYTLIIEGAVKHDIAGMLNWQLWDLQPGISMGSGRESNEDYYGLLRRDGTWKPAMHLFRDGWPGASATVSAPALPSRTTSNPAFHQAAPATDAHRSPLGTAALLPRNGALR